jgi:MFS family permease
MATKRETNVVYGAGLVQGIVLVTFPAASTIFTDPDEYDLTNTQYGFLFIPQVVTAIAASLLGAWLARRFGTKRVYLAGLLAGLTSMALLIVSTLFESNKAAALPLLLLATAFLGVGFGLTVPALNTLTAAFHPDAVETSVLVLNALLGLGTALAPAFVAIFVGLGFWWGLPVLSAALLALLILGSLRLPLRTESGATVARERRGIPARFWVFGGFAVLYGTRSPSGSRSGSWRSTAAGRSRSRRSRRASASTRIKCFSAASSVGSRSASCTTSVCPSKISRNPRPELREPWLLRPSRWFRPRGARALEAMT